MASNVKPKLVAICGAPKSGKSTVAGWLVERYGAQIVDDGAMLRRGVAALFSGLGVLPDDTFTQEGKAKMVMVCGKSFEVRQLLGDVGNLLEGFYGQQLMPSVAIGSIPDLEAAPFFVFPSCRKTQGQTYRWHGGLVVELVRPGYVPFNDFDHYDKSLVTNTVYNDEGEDELKAKVFRLFDGIYGS